MQFHIDFGPIACGWMEPGCFDVRKTKRRGTSINKGRVLAKYTHNLGSIQKLKAYVYIMRKSNFKESFYKGSLRRTSFNTLQIYYRCVGSFLNPGGWQ